MMVKNNSGSGVFVEGTRVPPGEQANVRDSDAVRELIKAGTLRKVESPRKTEEDGGDS